MLPNAIEWISDKHVLRLLDQRSLPYELKYRNCSTYQEIAAAIEDMIVRGAPAIGIVAAYGVAVTSYLNDSNLIDEAIIRLSKTRPTAVNLFWSLERMKKVFYNNLKSNNISNILESEAIKIHLEDIEINKSLSFYGQALLPENATVITHCNAGAFATGGYGTALGIFRAAKEKGKKIKVYVDETRPRLQGGLITSYELYEDGFDVTVICDSMAAFLMSRTKIDAVVVGADRVACNGDVANKIGTYSLAIIAKKHNVPFYVAAPLSTFDLSCSDGNSIPIELRSPDEVRKIGINTVIPDRIDVWNPAFDVTPFDLISAIITENGVLNYPFENKIKGCCVKN